MKSIIKLPFSIDETLRCYLCNAFFGGILSTYDNMEGWIVEHYIQMFYVSNRNILHSRYLESQINYYGGWTEPLALFERCLYSISSIESSSIVNWIRYKLEEGFYCYTYANEAYWGKQYNNAHDIIIIGKDDYRNIFWIVGYFRKRFQIKEIPYDLFNKAYTSGIHVTLNVDKNDGEEYIKLFRPRFDSSTIYELDLNNIIIRCEEYLNSINTGLLNISEDSNHLMYEMPNSVYGMKLYKKWQEELYINVDSNNKVDYRKFHVLYEHKLMMHRRVIYLQKVFEKVFDEVDWDNDKMIQHTSAMRLLALKYNNSLSKDTLLCLINNVKVLEEMDSFFINEFLCKLRELV